MTPPIPWWLTPHGRKRRDRRRAAERGGVVDGFEAGAAWIFGLLQGCHVFSTSFVQGDPHASSFKEGERNIGLRLLSDVMEAAPDRYVDMCKEGNG